MVTRRPAKQQPRKTRQLYIAEWFAALGKSDDDVAAIMNVSRETVWRWRVEKRKLNPDKLAELAAALGIKPTQFWGRPNEKSIDAILRGAPPDVVDAVYTLAINLTSKH